MKNIKKSLLFFVFVCIASSVFSQNSETHDTSLQHVLLFQWAEDINEESKKEVISLFDGLPQKIEGLESFELFEVKSSSGKFDNVLIFQFVSEEALKEYDKHPDHQRIKQIAPALLSGFAEYDYWK